MLVCSFFSSENEISAMSSIEQTSSDLSKSLEQLLGRPVELKINRNRRTMLSILEKSRQRVRLSLHEMFLKAPEAVLKDAAAFIKSPNGHTPKVLRFYIQEHVAKHKPIEMAFKEPLDAQGNFYDLQAEWQAINKRYFNAALETKVTWFGSCERRTKSQAILGLYDHVNDVIKVHRILDQESVPIYYIHYILYHEALHYVFPPFMDQKGVMKNASCNI
jgi:hypothetical protein